MTSTSRRRRPTHLAVTLLALGALTLAACGRADSTATPDTDTGTTATDQITTPDSDAATEATGGTSGEATGGDDADTTTDAAPLGGEVTLLAYDSFAVDPDVLASFEERSGLTVNILTQGSGGELVSKILLTQSNPLGDVAFGIGAAYASRLLGSGALVDYTSPLAGRGADRYAMAGSAELTAVDYGDVCINVDHDYFEIHDLPEPVTFEDLADPTYANMLVVPDAATSTPGLAFLFATIAHYGPDGWVDYWRALRDNGVKVVSGWTEAYTVDFSGSSGHGDRPLVVSYASSPPSEVTDDGHGVLHARTGALLDTCYRQVEYAGILSGAANPAGAEALVDFLLSEDFQAQLPEQMWVYPVDTDVDLPDTWQQFAPVADDPAILDPADIDTHREQWIADWSDLMFG